MKTPLLIVLAAVVLVAGGALAVMRSNHAWCAPVSEMRHHAGTMHG